MGTATRRPPYRRAPLACAIALVCPGLAQAAEQGELGSGPDASSTGSIDVTIEKRFAVLISSLEDIDFGPRAAADAPFVESGDFCVYSSTGLFNLTMTSDNGTGPTMAMVNTTPGDPDTSVPLLYEVRINGGAAAVASGVPQLALTGDAVDEDCGGEDNVDFTVTVNQGPFAAAAPGIYSDTLTMFVEPL